MVQRHPREPTETRFECRECGYGSGATSHRPTCPDCGEKIRFAPIRRE